MSRREVTVRRPTRAHRLEYLAYRTVAWVVWWLPERLALALGSFLGDVTGRLVRIRRSVVDANLELAFPDRPRRWRRRTAVAAYRHVGREAVTLLRLGRMDPGEVRRRTEVEGLERLREAVESGRGVIAVTGHFGNWEVGGAAVAARGIPTDVVAVRQHNPLFDRDLVAVRERLGMKVVEKRDAPREVLRSLRRSRLVALVADQNVKSGGVFVDFFGTPAATARGPALFALRSRAPVFMGMAQRIPGSPARYRVVFEELPLPPEGAGEEGVRRLTAAHQEALEKWVRAFPDQYFWHHRRWKTRPPEPAPEPSAGTLPRNRPPADR